MLLTAPLRAGMAVAGLAGSAALLGGDTAVRTGARALNAIPGVGQVSRSVVNMAVEAIGGPPARRSSRHGTRRWIEVRGLSGPDADAIATEVLAALREVPGVTDAVINASVSRVVVTIGPDGVSESLRAVVAEAERRARTEPQGARHRPITLPGDDEVLVARTFGAAAATVGLGLSLTGQLLRMPGLPDLVSVVPTVADHIPVVRRQLERRLGHDGTDLLFSVTNSLVATLTVSPTSAAAEAAARAMLAAEAWNSRLAWRRHEPLLADSIPTGGAPRRGTTEFAEGDAEDYANRAGWIGVVAAAAIGAVTRNPAISGAAALVAAPKPTRATREAFGCAMTRGLINHHDALVIRPRALRALDRVDVIAIDPRTLYTDDLMIGRVRGVENSHRERAWEAAQVALREGKLTPGWHPLAKIKGAGRAGEALVSPVRKPLASALVSEARKTGARVVSVDDDGLRSLAQGFDKLYPMGDSLDDALAGLVAELGADGCTVALLTTSAMAAQHEADITVGVAHGSVPPWGADVFVPDLPAVWRVLRAIPVARSTAAKGVRLSMSSSAIGALMLIPGVPGYGPESVNLGVLGGLWAGFNSGSKLFADPLPVPEPGHDWHALSTAEVQRLLPRPPAMSDQPHSEPSPLLLPIRALNQARSSTWTLLREFAGEMRSNLADPITPILATGAVASALLGSPLDAVLVGGVLLANAALSSEQQLHAERVLRRLMSVQDPLARRRVGELAGHHSEHIAAASLRPGDVIEVRAGEVVPADARLLEAGDLEVDESTLTGESLPVPKQTLPTPGAPLAERACMIYDGTTVVAGTALAVVTAVGPMTEMRRALAMAPTKSREIGLQRQLSRITNRALPWSLAGGAAVGLFSVLRGTPLRESVASAVALTVAAVPEGLPLVATLAQLAAARRLTNESVLVRNAHSVEALARLDVVCFDKTGTLSENRLRVKAVRPLTGYTEEQVLHAALSTSYSRHKHRVEHATDDAIHEAAGPQELAARDAFLPFQSGRPFAAALTGTRLTIKGAPEVLSSALADDSRRLDKLIAGMAAEGLRVLAVAERELSADQAAAAVADAAVMEELCRSGLTPCGLLGLADTPRPNARALLQELTEREIGVRLITGDHPLTATVAANELGLDVTTDQVITGSEWEALSAEERTDAVLSHVVFARMAPEHKIDVVQTLERAGLVTAMVGDGANDAAAIRAASVGIGVAARGSDPARTAADVVLLDGKIEALVDALDEGEQLWHRVQSAVSMLLGGNLGEVAFALLTSVATGRSVLNARQMLLVNMLTDALPAAALAVSPHDGTEQLDRDESAMWQAIFIRGTATTTGATLAWLMGRMTGTQRRAATIALIGLVSTQLAQTLADSRSPLVVATAGGSFVALAALISTPGVSQLFGCTPVDPLGWGQAFLATAAATAVSALAPGVLERLGSGFYRLVVDDDDAGPHEDGVDFPNRRRQQPDTGQDESVWSGEAEHIGHEIQDSPSP
ncbi:cation-translocating P-type ATPase [Mycobacterium sp. CVI_P3]|uniref:Cation-translocating P-type ATPase n=1 Tax=Mycobacterium pinniadriaticum TaxID=2994102 RepID=A0ABT3SMF7_9MYCO|nr:cation-translocating P-type ATPase [Mycobacterium pinniadriaticum]MCX2933668.1 cation-translocating P-type ATPase [Mycobacterium pinniadriaticum]MCX2940045.1 cation-translocating P-type ATPase [Mycobacterium pinniadriaticum]